MPLRVRGFVLHSSWHLADGSPRLVLSGALEGGGAFVVEESRFRPYAFVRESERAQLVLPPEVRVESGPLRDLAGHALTRVECDSPQQLRELRERAAASGVQLLEADLRPADRHAIDLGIRASLCIEGEPEQRSPRLLAFRDPRLEPADFRPELSVLSIDLETTPRADAIYAAALAGAGTEEVHVVSLDAVPGAQVYPDERALLQALLERIRALDPDVLSGWNVIDFDLRVLERRCRARRVPFALGRLPGRVRLEGGDGEGWAGRSRAEVPGRQVLDAMFLVRDAQLPLPDLRLQTAAMALLGRGKRIAPSADPAGEIQRLYREERAALAAYNLEDARLVRDLLAQEGLVALCVERSLATGLSLDRVQRSVAAFDSVYLPRLRARGWVAPSAQRERAAAALGGGAVLDSTPGLFRSVALFDFRSLYPSLMRTFNLDPLAYAQPGADPLRAPNGARFAREPGPLGEIVDEIWARRAAAQAAGQPHADRALKILLNSLYGVLGTRHCRFFEPQIANAIASFGQQTLGWTCEAIGAAGFRVLYGDTDSVFVALEREGEPAELRAVAEALRARAAAAVAERIRARYGVEPRLELRLEHIYTRFFQPRVRGGERGSKKRYAGLVDGELEVVGLEAVRRDWPPLARRFQLGLLERLFLDVPPLPFARELLAELRGGERPADLVFRRRLRKLPQPSRRPHLAALQPPPGPQPQDPPERASRYAMTTAGPQPLRPDGSLPAGVDLKYYIERVLRPIADAILPLAGTSFDEALGRPRQLELW